MSGVYGVSVPYNPWPVAPTGTYPVPGMPHVSGPVPATGAVMPMDALSYAVPATGVAAVPGAYPPASPPVAQTVTASRSPGGFDDIVAVIASAVLAFPMAGVGALIGVACANPALGATLAIGGGMTVGVLASISEMVEGSKPGANPPVRWNMVKGCMITPGLVGIGGAIGSLFTGAAGAASGACIAAGLPFALVLFQIIRSRFGSTPPAQPPAG